VSRVLRGLDHRGAGGLATLVVLLAIRGQLRLPARSDLPRLS
jgi:hypothetical protein